MTQESASKPFVRHRREITPIVAGDRCHLQELLRPGKNAGSDVHYSLAYAYVEPGGKTVDHLLHQSEVYYVIAGTGTMFLDGEAYPVEAGSFYYIPPRCRQWLQNNGPDRFEFLCIVDPPWTAAQEEVMEDAPQAK